MIFYASLALVTALAAIMHKLIVKSFFTFKRVVPKSNPKEALGLAYTDVYFKTVTGSQLHGWFVPVDDSVRGCVVLTPGWTLNTEYLMPLVAHIHKNLGFHCLLMEARFHGLSEGDASGLMNLHKVGDDIMSGVQYVSTRKDVNADKIGVVGFSFGAGGVMRASRDLSLIKFAVAISGFAHFDNVIATGQKKKGVPKGVVAVLLRYLAFVAGFSYDSVAPALIMSGFRKDFPLLIAHGDADAIVPYSEFKSLLNSASNNGLTRVHGVTVEGARHMNVVSNEKFIGAFSNFLVNEVKPMF